ncbi:MAG: UdgX family uracil-DNA binding protein [Caulobacterales bacterium]
MRCIALKPGADLAGFRAAARMLLQAQCVPGDIAWTTTAAPDLFDTAAALGGAPVLLPRAVAELIDSIILHSDAEKYALLYALLWRINHGERHVLEVKSDPLVHRLERMAKKVRTDIYKMHAFLRFRRAGNETPERFAAWWEPEHFILEAAAPFFVDRFPSFRWTIFTPIGSLLWNRETLTLGPPGRRQDAPEHDEFESGWKDYFESTFNPARVNERAMLAQMPKKYWRNMPETRSIPGMIQIAASRVDAMIEKEAAMPVKRNPQKAVDQMFDQDPDSLEDLNRIITASDPMVSGGTKAVLGEGLIHPDIAFVGEQPGDQEDLAGRPFVGPAGQLLNRAMEAAGFERSQVYVTNAVKHFKFEQRGKRRLHKTPTTSEVKHYRWWLEKELELVQPKLVVALGATATLALAGKALPINANRGAATFGDQAGYITVHPSYMLRLQEDDSRQDAFDAFVADLKKARNLAEAA